MQSSPIHKGLVIDTDNTPGYVKVWIPTSQCVVPNGFSEYMYENTGGQLFGSNLADAQGSAYRCKIACPLSAGAWFKASTTLGASIFDDYSDTAYDYRLMYNYQTNKNNGNQPQYILPTDNPQVTGAVTAQTLSVTGGNSVHRVGTMPKGQFPILQKNQWVLVAFLAANTNPVVLMSLHSDEAWNVIQNQIS